MALSLERRQQIDAALQKAQGQGQGGLTPERRQEIDTALKYKLPKSGPFGQVLEGIGQSYIGMATDMSALGEAVEKTLARAFLPKNMEEKLGIQKGQPATAYKLIPEVLRKATTPWQKVGYAAGVVAQLVVPVEKILAQPVQWAAAKMYGRALKPSTTLAPAVRKAIIQTGLDERIFLTQGGVEKVTTRIDDLEATLDDAIKAGQAAGKKIKTSGLTAYLDDIKAFFSNYVDVGKAKDYVAKVDDLGTEFIKEYGDEIPIEKAQKIKVASGKILRKFYGEMSGAEVEGSKQIVRYLKDQVLESAPLVGDINKRLKALYEFDKVLARASNRIRNLNLLGLSSRIGAAAGGVQGGILGGLIDALGKPGLQSAAAIGFKKLPGLVSAPVAAGVGAVREEILNKFFPERK